MEEKIISDMKQHINTNDVEFLKLLWSDYQTYENFNEVAWDCVFKSVYIHACLKGKQEIVSWLDELYKEFDPIIQISLRQMFPYARRLLQKAISR